MKIPAAIKIREVEGGGSSSRAGREGKTVNPNSPHKNEIKRAPRVDEEMKRNEKIFMLAPASRSSITNLVYTYRLKRAEAQGALNFSVKTTELRFLFIEKNSGAAESGQF